MKMRSDPIVDEIREIRQQHTDEFQRDLHAICEDIRRQERESSRKFVKLSPRRVPIVVMPTGSTATPSNAASQSN
jgi:hypothetical protein